MNYGFHRVIKPKGVVPQSAWKVNNTPKKLHPTERLLRVKFLNLDSTSMRQIKRDYKDVGKRILEIIRERGKMHNPITNSGGVLLGEDPSTGGSIVPLVSLSGIPLYLSSVGDIIRDKLEAEGTAVLFESYPTVAVPDDIGEDLALSALDISSIVPQVRRVIKNGQVVVIVGCGKAGLSAMATIHRYAPRTKIVAVDMNSKNLDFARHLRYASAYLRADAAEQKKFLKKVESITKEKMADVVINAVNVPDTEASSILVAKPRGKVLFFSMATEFNKAALGTDATGKDVDLIIGNGIAENQAEQMFDLLRSDKKFLNVFKKLA